MADNLDNELKLSSQEREELVAKKITCPFLGTAVATGLLHVRNSLAQPLAKIDDIVELGNSGGGNLGIDVLRFFARGNHASMPGASGRLDQRVPSGTFSLDLPGSQGSHPGHSGILQGDPNVPGSGRFSQEDFDRLTSRAKGGKLKRSDIAAFIAENIRRDPDAKIFSLGEFFTDSFGVLGQTIPAGIESFLNKFMGAQNDEQERKLVEKVTAFARSSNVAGSAGEFGLLLAFLEDKPGSAPGDGEPAVSVEDLTRLFKEKKFPEGWDERPKTRASWLRNTFALLLAAHKELGL